jgi:hypothetical protein
MPKIGGASGKSFIIANVELLGGLGVAIALPQNLPDESKQNKVILINLSKIPNLIFSSFFLGSLKNLAKS